MGELKYVEGKVIIQADLQSKNWHTFESGQKIRLERQWNNLNRRVTEPVNSIVISGENIEEGSEILVHPNALIETNKINNYKKLSGENEASDIKYYSVPEEMCYAWLDGEEWKPLKNFAFALRVFKPYNGIMVGIEPTLIKEVLYITTGELKGNVCHVLKASDYEIVFQGIEGREDTLIRLRHSDEEEIDREEIVAIDHSLTEKVNKNVLLIGLSSSTAKPLNEILCDNRIY